MSTLAAYSTRPYPSVTGHAISKSMPFLTEFAMEEKNGTR